MTTPLIRRLTIRNFLSYGPGGMSVDLLPLNVLIGPNASGKSNLLEALSILRATSHDLQTTVREGGGISEYVWKHRTPDDLTLLIAEVDPQRVLDVGLLKHRIALAPVGSSFVVWAEVIDVESGFGDNSEPVYEYGGGEEPMLLRHRGRSRASVGIGDIKAGQSILSQRRDPEQYPEITYLADQYSSIALFQEWNLGRRAPMRLPQPTDLPSEFLLPDASNLGLVLHDLVQTSAKREELIGYLQRFYESARYIATRIQGGTLQLYIEEEGGRLTPATRLSDGTLRYLCLLAILCHPNPPPVIGIEEPELGLHPDIMPTVAELLKKASERTQLFVTTHSDALVSALSDTPESVLVCESMPNGTTIERLEPQKLSSWLDDYRLGEIWRMGALGGNRW